VIDGRGTGRKPTRGKQDRSRGGRPERPDRQKAKKHPAEIRQKYKDRRKGEGNKASRGPASGPATGNKDVLPIGKGGEEAQGEQQKGFWEDFVRSKKKSRKNVVSQAKRKRR
ncbi:ribonuclease R, partial [Brevibacillus agri]|nr:ribonuclease R [Brevibacillus agri]